MLEAEQIVEGRKGFASRDRAHPGWKIGPADSFGISRP